MRQKAKPESEDSAERRKWLRAESGGAGARGEGRGARGEGEVDCRQAVRRVVEAGKAP